MTQASQQSVSVAPHESVCTAVITALANAKGVDPRDLSEQLNDIVDPDALNCIFKDTATGPARTAGHVCFEMAGCEVVVQATGRIIVTDSKREIEVQASAFPPQTSQSSELATLDG